MKFMVQPETLSTGWSDVVMMFVGGVAAAATVVVLKTTMFVPDMLIHQVLRV